MKKLVSLLLSIMLTISMTTNMAFAGNRVDSTVEEAVMYISGVKATLTGTKYSVEYQEDVFNDSYEGYTPNTWRTTEFARALWTDSMSNVAFPGYIGFPATYPL